jgi:hypothetical protein
MGCVSPHCTIAVELRPQTESARKSSRPSGGFAYFLFDFLFIKSKHFVLIFLILLKDYQILGQWPYTVNVQLDGAIRVARYYDDAISKPYSRLLRDYAYGFIKPR